MAVTLPADLGFDLLLKNTLEMLVICNPCTRPAGNAKLDTGRSAAGLRDPTESVSPGVLSFSEHALLCGNIQCQTPITPRKPNLTPNHGCGALHVFLRHRRGVARRDLRQGALYLLRVREAKDSNPESHFLVVPAGDHKLYWGRLTPSADTIDLSLKGHLTNGTSDSLQAAMILEA